MNKRYLNHDKMKVAVVGATGLVGTRMLEVLAERATLRIAELGFLGVVVYTRTHTPLL